DGARRRAPDRQHTDGWGARAAQPSDAGLGRRGAVVIRVLIVDDHPIFRAGLRNLITDTGDMLVVAEVDDGIAALRVADEVAWDVALLDVSLPVLNGIEVLRRLGKSYPERKILMLSQFPEDQFEARMIREGATG